jgi:hypothetical protein
LLIDKTHDFELKWLALAVKVLNPSTEAFLMPGDMQKTTKGWGGRCGASEVGMVSPNMLYVVN